MSNNPQETTEDQSLKAKAHQIVLQQHIATAKLRAKKGAHLDTVLFRGRHPALAPLLSEMAPMKIWATTTVADLNIAGLPKAGTSHFYRILTTHAHATVFDPLTKEQCVKLSLDDKRLIEGWDLEPFRDEATDRQRMIQLGLKRFHRGQHKRVSHSPATNKTTVNGCIYYPDVELSWFYVRPPASKKYFFLFRDPADWLWASYNFWQDAVYDPGSFDKEYEGRGFWINDKEHYRSPEMFHEFIASGTKTRMGARMISFRDWTVAYPRRLRAMVGNASSMFIRNEDLLPSVVNQPGGVLDRVAEFSGLDRGGFDALVLGQTTNCNQKKGERAVCKENENSGAYAITGHRAMLPETRQLIYLQFWEECKIWAKEFGIVYPRCLNVMADVT